MSKEKIDAEKLLSSVDIVDIINAHVPLTKQGAEHYGICPFHSDTTQSLQVRGSKQIFKCFACGEGGDAIAFLMKLGATFHEACAEISGEATKVKGPGELNPAKLKKAVQWKQIPPTSPPTDITHYMHGKPAKVWAYRTGEGKLIGYVCRFNMPDGSKEVLPFVFATDGSRSEWRWHGFNKPRPIYNLHGVTANKDKTVILFEGEKTADAGGKLIPTSEASTWIGGARAIKETDWSPLFGRNIILWPDNDKEQKYGEKHEKAGQVKPWEEQPGNSAMLEIENILAPHCPIIRWVRNAEDFPDKWDIADATEWTSEQASNYVRKNIYDRKKVAAEVAPAPAQEKKSKPPEPAPQLPAEHNPPHNEEEDEDPFKFLGFDKSESGGQRFYFFVKSSSSVFSYASSSLSKVNLMTLAPMSWWEDRFTNKRGLDLDSAQNFIVFKGSQSGTYDESLIRGRGAWVNGDNVVLHAGTKLIINGHNKRLRDHGSKYIYEAGKELGFHIENPLPTRDASKLLDVIDLLNWERPINKYLFAGWCILAPVCGALTWRPHIWLTGAAGTGKSWVFKYLVRRLLGKSVLAVQSETTEAGIRQILGHDALPVVFDEAEGPERRDSERIQTILNLMRSASAEDGGLMAKGSAGGTAKTYRIRSCFAFASISVGVYLQSDRSRVSILALSKEHDRKKKDDKWNELKKLYSEVITEEYCNKLRARTVKNLPVIIKNAQTFSDAVAFELGEQRAGDQLGTLLAGAFSLVSDKIIGYEDACKWVKEKDWSEEKSAETYRDEVALFAYLMEQITRIETQIGSIERNVGELVKLAATDGDYVITPEMAQDRLKRLGFKVEPGFILVSNTSDYIKKILANTQWSKNHNKILQRLPGAESVTSARFGSGFPTKAIKIPLSLILSEDNNNAGTAHPGKVG